MGRVDNAPRTITEPQAYVVYAAVWPRSDLDEYDRGLIAIQIETAPGPKTARGRA